MNDQHKLQLELQRDLMIMMLKNKIKDSSGAGGEPSTTRTVAAPPPDEEDAPPAHYLYSASLEREDEHYSPMSFQCATNPPHETTMTTMATSRPPPPLVDVARPPASSSLALAGVHDGAGISPSAATGIDICGISCAPAASGNKRAGTNSKNGVKNTSMPEKKARASYMINHSSTTATTSSTNFVGGGAKTKTSEDSGGSSGGDTSTLQAAAALLALFTNEEQAAADKKDDGPDEEKEKTKKSTTSSTIDDSLRPNSRKKHYHLTASAILEMTRIRREKKKSQGRPYAAAEDDSTSPGKDICPTEHDVLSGRGNGINAHPGNQIYRKVILRFKDGYIAASKRDKASFPSKIISEIEKTDPPGRFLRFNPESNGWIQMPMKNAITKTRQVRSLAGCWKRVLNHPS